MKAHTPAIIKIGTAIKNRPFKIRPIMNSGIKITVTTIFEIPHAALTANTRILPNIMSVNTPNNNYNILIISPCFCCFLRRISSL